MIHPVHIYLFIELPKKERLFTFSESSFYRDRMDSEEVVLTPDIEIFK